MPNHLDLIIYESFNRLILSLALSIHKSTFSQTNIQYTTNFALEHIYHKMKRKKIRFPFLHCTATHTSQNTNMLCVMPEKYMGTLINRSETIDIINSRLGMV